MCLVGGNQVRKSQSCSVLTSASPELCLALTRERTQAVAFSAFHPLSKEELGPSSQLLALGTKPVGVSHACTRPACSHGSSAPGLMAVAEAAGRRHFVMVKT